MHVLLVEDNVNLCEVLKDFLADLGHQARSVSSAEEALGELRTRPPDLVLLDVYLPGMSGLDFLQHAEVRESGVPVVVMSGHATEGQALECLRLGARDFVAKPLPLEHLARILEALEPTLDRAPEPAMAPATAPAAALAPVGDRRRAPRVQVSLPARVLEYSGEEWAATCVNLSVGGAKLRAERAGRPGLAVQLSLLPREGVEPLTLLSLLVRIDVDGYAFHFANLSAAQTARLRDLVRRLG